MSVQTNQFLMYGLKLDPKKLTNALYDKYEPFMDDSAFTTTVNHKDGVFCCYDGMSGYFLIVGKVIEKSQDGELIGGPIEITTLLSKNEKVEIAHSIQRNFSELLPLGEWACDYIFLTQYR